MNVESSFGPELMQPKPDVLDILDMVIERLDSTDERMKHDVANLDEHARERAMLIMDLPDLLTQYENQGVDIPIEIRGKANTWACLAENVLNDNNTFGMSVLLEPRGASSDSPEPTDIHKLVSQLRGDTEQE